MTEFLHMGGYAGYVWASYAVFLLVLLADAVAPILQRRATLREIAARLRRASSRSNHNDSPGARVEGENR